ncbi:MAG TPA: heat-inducible transcriptional repressor HrcA [Thermoanaerobaculia bacterium]
MGLRIDVPREDELDPRAREVLCEIVLQYTASGEPISSRSLAKCGRFALSPASLRNVMADLEDLGYVLQPHTSAGRVPTDRGFRFFISHLMKSRRLTSHERGVIDESVAQIREVDEMMAEASKVLSKLTNQVGVVFMPSLHQLTMRSIDFILVGEAKIMCVIVGTNGVVVNKVIDSTGGFSRDELEKVSHYLSDEFSGLTLEAIRDHLVRIMHEERSQHDALLRSAISLGINAVEEVVPIDQRLHVEGAASILDKPEFSDADAMRKTFLAFEQKERLVEILNQCLNENELHVLIGGEAPFTQNYNFALVVSRYGSPVKPLGVVGVIGPMRMEYARTVTLVEYLGRALSRKIEESEEPSS